MRTKEIQITGIPSPDVHVNLPSIRAASRPGWHMFWPNTCCMPAAVSKHLVCLLVSRTCRCCALAFSCTWSAKGRRVCVCVCFVSQNKNQFRCLALRLVITATVPSSTTLHAQCPSCNALVPYMVRGYAWCIGKHTLPPPLSKIPPCQSSLYGILFKFEAQFC